VAPEIADDSPRPTSKIPATTRSSAAVPIKNEIAAAVVGPPAASPILALDANCIGTATPAINANGTRIHNTALIALLFFVVVKIRR